MNFDAGTVQTYRFKPHAKKTLVLQAFKNLVQNTGLVPPALKVEKGTEVLARIVRTEMKPKKAYILERVQKD